MAGRSLLHDLGVQRARIIQVSAFKAHVNESTAAEPLRSIWLSPEMADPRAKFGLLAISSIQSGEKWEEAFSAQLAERR